MADFLLSRNLLSLIAVRKLFSSLGKDRCVDSGNHPLSARALRGLLTCPHSPGLLLPSICAVALPFVTSSYIATIALLILIPGTSNLCDSGFIINTLDIAPR